MKKNISLKTSMIAYFFTTITIIIVILATALIGFLNFNIINFEQQKLEMSVQNSSKYISLYIDSLSKDIKLLSQTPSILEFISTGNVKNKKQIQNLLINIKNKDKNIKKISIITKNGESITTDSEINENMGSNMMEEKWYIDAMVEDIILNPTFEKSYGDINTWVLSMSKNIYIGDKQGVIILDLHYLALYDYLNTINLGKAGEIYVVDDKNNIIYSRDIKDAKMHPEVILDIASKNKGYNKKDGKIYFNTIIENTNFKIIGVNSGDRIKEMKNHVLQIMIFFSLLMAASIYLIVFFLSNRLSVSLKELEKQMQKINNDFEDFTLSEKTFKEIDVLKEEINYMKNRIRELKKYEIDSLYSQINPHFIYNTLDTLIWMIEFEESDRAVKLTKNLADFFRLSLSQGRRLITVSEEIEHVRKYLEIQKERYQEKLNYTINLDENVKDKKIPKIILQPLVENAIYHGIKNKEGNGNIVINAKLDKDNHILLEVIDDGVGMKRDIDPKVKLGGVGMKNIDSRLKHYCSECSGLMIDRSYKNGTKIVLQLKEIENQEDEF